MSSVEGIIFVVIDEVEASTIHTVANARGFSCVLNMDLSYASFTSAEEGRRCMAEVKAILKEDRMFWKEVRGKDLRE